MTTETVILIVVLVAFVLLVYLGRRVPDSQNMPEDRLTKLLLSSQRMDPKLAALLKTVDTAGVCLVLAEHWGLLPAALQQDLRAFLGEQTEEIIGLLSDEEAAVRSSAAEILGWVDSPEVPRVLLRALADKNEAVRLAASSSLSKLKNVDLLVPLIDALQDPETWVPARIAEVLVAFCSEAVEPLASAIPGMDDEGKCRAAGVLGEIGDLRAAPVLKELLAASSSADVRAAAAEALGEIGGEDVVPVLKKAARDEAWKVRMRAVGALAKTGRGDLVPVFKAALRDEEWQVRAAAETALAGIAAAKEET